MLRRIFQRDQTNETVSFYRAVFSILLKGKIVRVFVPRKEELSASDNTMSAGRHVGVCVVVLALEIICNWPDFVVLEEVGAFAQDTLRRTLDIRRQLPVLMVFVNLPRRNITSERDHAIWTPTDTRLTTDNAHLLTELKGISNFLGCSLT